MKLRVFLWNDDYKTMTHWQNALSEARFDVIPSHEENVEKVLDAYRKSQCDFVVLDVLHNSSENPIGLWVARGIRKFDLLVPMVAVTTKPEHIYSQGDKPEDLDFIGIFESTIMLQKGSLRELGIRRPLNLWHEVLPEFALVRGVDTSLARHMQQNPTIAELRHLIVQLPVSGGHDVWHGKLCLGLSRLFRTSGMNELADIYNQVVSIFTRADGFYMAAGWSRKHLSHNVQVFLLGLYFLLGLVPIRTAAIKNLRQRGAIDDDDALTKAILAWACVATTHDTAYLAQDLSSVHQKLTEAVEPMRQFLGGTTSNLPDVKWPKVHHSVIGARLWLQGLPEDSTKLKSMSDHLQWLVAQGIARHDTKALPELHQLAFLGVVSEKKVPLNADTWIQFLAVMADELQDWQRNRPEELARFRSFALDAVQHQPNFVALGFVTRDHSSVVRVEEGMDPTSTVEKHFRSLLDRLETYLDAEKTLKIELSATFSSRGSLERSVDATV